MDTNKLIRQQYYLLLIGTCVFAVLQSVLFWRLLDREEYIWCIFHAIILVFTGMLIGKIVTRIRESYESK